MKNNQTGYPSPPEYSKQINKYHMLLWSIALFFAVALVWAQFATLDEVTVADGKVIPASKVQMIQHLEGGIIEKILVHEGQTVKANQPLMYLEDTRFSSEFRSNQLKRIELKIRIVRLKAQVQKIPFRVSNTLKKQAGDLAKTEKALYKSKMTERPLLLNRLNLLKREIKITAPLVKEGAISEVEVLRLQQRKHELSGNLHALTSETLDELNKAKAELSRLAEAHVALKDRVERTIIKSPVKGIVKQIHVETVGAVVQPGMSLMEIVPLKDTLRVEARVRPSDIAFIHPGQKVIIKLTAYDFSIYGGLDGYVEHISADTTKDDKGNSYYEIWVRTKKAYLGTKKNPLPIIPGMQASVDILTGKKTVLDYLLKPILKAKQRALRER